jgi:hypothetical protein
LRAAAEHVPGGVPGAVPGHPLHDQRDSEQHRHHRQRHTHLLQWPQVRIKRILLSLVFQRSLARSIRDAVILDLRK